MKRALFLIVICAPLLLACATARPRDPQPALPAAFEAPSRGSALPAAALDQWWTLYDDNQLSGLVEEALARGFDIRLAASRLEQARAVRQGALQQYDPRGDAAASASRRHTVAISGASQTLNIPGIDLAQLGAPGDVDSASASFDVSWELDLFGRRRAAARAANADLRTAEFTYEATRWSLAAEVANDLFQARGLAIQLQEAEQALRIQKQLLDTARTKVDHGLAPSSDAAQAEASYQSSQAQADSLAAQLDAARRALLLAVGRGTDPLASLQAPAAVGSPPPIPATLPGELLARRPDVREAEWRLASAAGQLTLSQLALFPSFTLQPGLGLSRSTGQTTGSWTLGLGASVPILSIPRLLSQLRAQRAISEQAVLGYEQAVQAAYGDAETSFAYMDSDARRVRLLAAAERNAGQAYEAKRIGYGRGFNDLQTALSAESAWRQARLSLAGAQVTLMQRSVQLFKALGGGWAPNATR